MATFLYNTFRSDIRINAFNQQVLPQTSPLQQYVAC